MSSKGRGSFLTRKSEGNISTEAEASLRDSGFVTHSPGTSGEYRRVGRGKLLEDITTSWSNISLSSGRGRAHLLESIRNPDHSPEEQKEILPSPSGRAKALSSFLSLEQCASSAIPVTNEPTDTTAEREKTPAVLYNPPNTQGSKGTPLKLACNYIRLRSDPTKGVFVYEVRFSPNVDSVALRMKYLNEHRDSFGGTKTFDGVTLYLPILLKNKLTTFVSKSVADGSDIEVRIMYKKQEALKNCMHLYNVLFDRVMKTLNFVRFDRKQYDPTSPKIIPQAKLEVWPGYVTAVDEYDAGLMLCCDVSHRLLCQRTVLETLVEIYQSNPHQFHDTSKKALLGSVVITRYNNKTYRIDDISFDQSPLSLFRARDVETSFFDYYRKNHNIVIKDKQQPLLISIKKMKSKQTQDQTEDLVFCLIPELCYLTGMTDNIRSDNKLMRDIATFTRVSPNERVSALEKFYNNINNCSEAQQILANWGLTINREFEYVGGRRLEEQRICFAKKEFSVGLNAEFSRHATNNELLEVVNWQSWLLIHCKNDTRCVKSFIEQLRKCTPAMGIEIRDPKIVVLDNDRIDTFVNALRANIKSEMQMVVCISPTSRDDRYAAIKKVCCAEIPIPSQVINARTISNDSKLRSIVQKIVLQINCKLGGSLWAVKIPFKSVMICGIDSYHDGSQKGNSVAAFVASLNPTYTKWYSKAVIQTKREEILNGLCASFTMALLAYQRHNGKLPDNVIVYRDGVGDGQLQLCMNYEIPQLEAAVKRMFTNYTLKITYIVAQKRINTRFFETHKNQKENPLPGTIVDSCITNKNTYDFYLVSQSVRQGTVTPTHFIVLRNDAESYTPDIIQRLTYKLCFLYYNWPGTIRLPACCQYAHKMAYLIGQSVRKETAEELSTKLFYL